VILRVCDTGMGMSEEAREHLFEPFYSTKGVENAGLGLATAWGIVRQHQGTVLVDNPPDGGTWVTVYLPGQDAVDS
jgi:signal transduction histidine kinase